VPAFVRSYPIVTPKSPEVSHFHPTDTALSPVVIAESPIATPSPDILFAPIATA